MTIAQYMSTRATSIDRGLIHDLRNLFGVVASAKHMLEDEPAKDRRDALLAAIEDAAQRGGQLTSNLLAPADVDDAPMKFDSASRLLTMAPMIRAIAGEHAEVRFDIAEVPLPVKLAPARFEAAILELITNASAALHQSGNILVRVRPQGRHVLIAIADDGIGMDETSARKALDEKHPVGVKGTGLSRVRQFARSSHGSMRLRSRAGRGTIVVLALPMILSLVVDETAVPPGRHQSPV